MVLPKVKPAPKYKTFDESTALYACRLVKKISSKGKELPRLLLLTETMLVMAAPTGHRQVRRFIFHNAIKDIAVETGAAPGASPKIMIRTAAEDEPDLVFSQSEPAELPMPRLPNNGTDLPHLINQLRTPHPDAPIVPIRAMTMQEMNQNSNLKRGPNYTIHRERVMRGDIRKHDKEVATLKNDRGSDTSGETPPGGELFTLHLQQPAQELGISVLPDEGNSRPVIIDVEPNSVAGRERVPKGVIHSLNGEPTDNFSKFTAKVVDTKKSGSLKYDFIITPMKSNNIKVLLIGISYLRGSHTLPNATADVLSLAQALEGIGYCSPQAIRIICEPSSEASTRKYNSPTRQNILAGFSWLAEGADAQSSLFLGYVGHSVQKKGNHMRDGHGEAIFPLDFDSQGVITEEEVRTRIIDPLPAGAKLTIIADSCGAGTLVNLPLKVKAVQAKLLSTIAKNAPNEGQRAPQVLQLSSWNPNNQQSSPKSANSSGKPVVATGAIIQGYIQSLTQDPEPTIEQLLVSVRNFAVHKVGVGSQTPQISCNYKASVSDVFSPARPPKGSLKALTPIKAAVAKQVPQPASVPRERAVTRQSEPRRRTQEAPVGSPTLQTPASGDFPSASNSRGGSVTPPTPLTPDQVRSKIPQSVLQSPGLNKLLTVQGTDGTPEIFYATDIICLEARPVQDHGASSFGEYPVVMWPTVKVLFVSREALYTLDPNGDIDRCVPLQDIKDFILVKGGTAIEASVVPIPAGPSTLPGGRNPWLAVRVPSQYELLFQPSENSTSDINEFIDIVNCLMQHGNVSLLGGQTAKILVVDTDGMPPGSLRLLRPANYSFPWIPIQVRIWPHSTPTIQSDSLRLPYAVMSPVMV